MLETLRAELVVLNRELPKNNLVAWTSGNVSARDPSTGLVVIKPSGIRYGDLTPESMVVVDLDVGSSGALDKCLHHVQMHAPSHVENTPVTNNVAV